MSLFASVSFREILQHPFFESLGWTLLHSLWQGTGVAVVLWIVLIALRRASANVRYLASCAALLLLLVMPVITLAFLAPRESSADAVLVSDVGGISERRMENINRPPVVESTMSHSIPSVPTVNSLTVSQLEAILAHELAHIRRADFVVNLLQSAIETLLFYHPAVWWISSSIRQEREHCCDDLAASISGDKAGYVAALVRMEELRSVSRAVALAARGGNLLVRVRRLLRPPAPDRLSHWWLTGMMTSLIVVSLIALPLRAKLKAEPTVAQVSALKDDKKNRKSESRKNEARLAIVEGIDNITPAQIADRIEEAWKRYESIEYDATIEETRNTTAFSGDAKPTLVDGTGKTAFTQASSSWTLKAKFSLSIHRRRICRMA